MYVFVAQQFEKVLLQESYWQSQQLAGASIAATKLANDRLDQLCIGVWPLRPVES